MPLNLTASVEAAIEVDQIAHAWLLELFTDEGALRCWDKPFDMSYGGNTYEGLGDSWEIAGEIRLGTDLVPEPLTFNFDGSRILDNADFTGRLVDRSWHQREMRLTGLLFVPGQRFGTPIGPHLIWNGTMDTLENPEGDGSISGVVLSCEGGIFRALDRNMTVCTDADQKRRNPSDRLFENVATKPQQDVPFGRAWSNVPGGSGRGGSGGGGGGGNSWARRSF